MESLQLRVSDVAYHLERLSSSKIAQKAVEKKDKESFRIACKKLHVPEKYVDNIVKIVFSSVEPDQITWPWS